MKISAFTVKGNKKKQKAELPGVFDTLVREDLIKRAVLAQQSSRYQSYAPNHKSGKRTSAESWGPGYGASRVPRVKGSRYAAANRGAFAPGTVGGRRGHPPEVERKTTKKINVKEKKLATASALAATASYEKVTSRGHRVSAEELPLVLDSSLEKISTAKKIRELLYSLGLGEDLERARTRKIRPGKGKRRGRKYTTRKSVLIVVGEDRGISRGAENLPGVEVALAREVNAEQLAPGTHAGRLTIYTFNALKELERRFPHEHR